MDNNTRKPDPKTPQGSGGFAADGFGTNAEAARNRGSVPSADGPAISFGNAGSNLTGAARELCRQTDARYQGLSKVIPIPLPKKR